jgi:hypothetical protein
MIFGEGFLKISRKRPEIVIFTDDHNTRLKESDMFDADFDPVIALAEH